MIERDRINCIQNNLYFHPIMRCLRKTEDFIKNGTWTRQHCIVQQSIDLWIHKMYISSVENHKPPRTRTASNTVRVNSAIISPTTLQQVCQLGRYRQDSRLQTWCLRIRRGPCSHLQIRSRNCRSRHGSGTRDRRRLYSARTSGSARCFLSPSRKQWNLNSASC